MHAALCALHSLAIRFALVATSDFEALESDCRGSEDEGGGAVAWVISGWKAGWALSTSARLLWCVGKTSPEHHRTVG